MLTRRAFLQDSATASGGLIISLSLAGCGESGHNEAAGPPRTIAPNAWLKISTDGNITFLCDRSEMGQGVYTALPTLLAEELGVDPTAIRVEFAPAGQEYVNNLLGTQVTGGSTSVRDAWEKLRTAGAEARMRLIEVGAKRLKVDARICRVENGFVIAGSGRAPFGELVEDAAKLPKPARVELKDRKDFRFIGKPTKRLDTPSKVDGSAQYGIDIHLSGLLYASLLQPPELGAAVKSFNADRAKDMPGVRQVVQTKSGIAVIADSWWQARKARDAITVEWQAGPNAKLSNASIFAGLKTASAQPGRDVRKEGDVEAAWKAASSKVEAAYELPLLAHATMEPQNCTVDIRDGECHVYVPTQVQLMAQAAASQASGLPPEKVFVHTTFLGGGFGRRLDVDFVPAAVECAKAVGKPVKLLWTREDDTTHDVYRPPAYDTVGGAFDANGKLSAWKLHLVGPSITSRWAPAAVKDAVDPFAVEAAQNFPYDVPNIHIDYLQHEIGIDVGYMRSVSHALNCFVVESFMDELAASGKMDPYEFRWHLLGKQPRWQAVLEAASGKAGWGAAREGHHLGIALMSGYDSYLAQVVDVSVKDKKLTVNRIVCVVDCGQVVNPDIVKAQAEGGIVFGLTSALFGEINIENGKVREQNFDKYRMLRMSEMPKIEIYLVDSNEKPGGMGEPTVALVAPALCNAIYSATGKRLRSLPIVKQGFTV